MPSTGEQLQRQLNKTPKRSSTPHAEDEPDKISTPSWAGGAADQHRYPDGYPQAAEALVTRYKWFSTKIENIPSRVSTTESKTWLQIIARRLGRLEPKLSRLLKLDTMCQTRGLKIKDTPFRQVADEIHRDISHLEGILEEMGGVSSSVNALVQETLRNLRTTYREMGEGSPPFIVHDGDIVHTGDIAQDAEVQKMLRDIGKAIYDVLYSYTTQLEAKLAEYEKNSRSHKPQRPGTSGRRRQASPGSTTDRWD
ncbi:unnamed protein product [Zymoseptoria tritici ST99CH_1E4]|uniref:Uncharacterized protein n=1 Tax=Zymoseptoria tritici ST99CH_1E4 TaxID=1276532 RepID=A0A2H1H5E5_ZYMTR|nr:unnamed protein product [Zymoseptoria tritici ST99CH_1E4]